MATTGGFPALRRAVGALAMLGALAACGGGGSEPANDGRVADSRLPLRYEVKGLEGSGGVGLVIVSGGAYLQIPLSGNGLFSTDTDGAPDDPMYPDGLFPADTLYSSLNDPETVNPVQFCRTPTGSRSIDVVLVFDCTRTPLRYEVSGLQGSGATLELFITSPSGSADAFIALPLVGNGSFATDTDTGADDPAYPDGRFPRDADFSVLGNAVANNPAQFCRATPAEHAIETLLKIECGPRPLVYEVRGLVGSGASVEVVTTSDTAYPHQYTLRLTANGIFATDTDADPEPVMIDKRDDQPYPPGLFPQETLVRTFDFIQPTHPAQICTVNGRLQKRDRFSPIVGINEPLVIDCGSVTKAWRFDTGDTVNLPSPPGAGASGHADSVEVYRDFTYTHPELSGPSGPMGPLLGLADQDVFANLLDEPGPNAGMYSSADGRTYWIATEAANGPSTYARIETRWGVRVLGDDAKFSLTLSALQLAGIMAEGLWSSDRPFVSILATMEVRVHTIRTGPDGSDVVSPIPFRRQYDLMRLYGRQVPGGPKHWELEQLLDIGSGRPIFDPGKFVLNTSGGDNRTGGTGHAVLRESIEIPVDLSGLAEDDRVLIVVSSSVGTNNYFNRESRAVAYLRDPATFDPGREDQAISVTEVSGLALFTPPALPADFTPQPDLTPAPACSAPDAPRAVLQFGAASYAVDERDAEGRVVTVTRSGSTQGAVTARLRLLPGSAQAGVDYVAQETLVRFGDGDTSPRSLHIEVIDDTLVEDPESLTVVLDQPGGCADIGPLATTTVTVLDDEALVPSQYTLGGTVTGLVGSGLVIENVATEALPITANGAFQFPRVFAAGHVYRIQVSKQPQNPRQACTVANGEGTVTNANIGNVQIHCTTLGEPGGLDPGFGTGGRVWSTTMGATPADTALARQADGKLLVVGGNAGLLRLLPDGTPDAGFGAAGNGLLTVTRGQRTPYNVAAVTVQPDGRIVVAGFAPDGLSGRADMLVARFLADGTPDASFAGGTGIATFDFGTWNDAASRVLVQPDGGLLLAGRVSDASGSGATDFAVLRLTAAGQIDTTYGSNGWARADVAGGYDVPRGAALTPDGGVVLVGRVAASGGANGDVGIVKFTAAGLPDTAFGATGNGTVRVVTAVQDEARDIAVLPDGRLLVVGERDLPGIPGAAYELWLARYFANGQLDTGFGNGGVATLSTLMRGYAVAVQADGTVWVAGETPSADGSSADYGLARFTATGQPDGSFGTGGLLGVDMYGGFDIPGALLLQADGQLLMAGQAYNGSTQGLGLVRVTP